MARWARSDYRDVPARLAKYRAADWGTGQAAIREWSHACLQWLADNPDRRLPLGRHGDQLDVIRESVRLQGGYGPRQPRRGIGW